MPTKAHKYARYYFGISIKCLIPINSSYGHDRISNNVWEQLFLERLRLEIKTKLPKGEIDIVYRTHTPIDARLRLFEANFVVAILHRFRASQTAQTKFGIDNVKSGFVRQARRALEKEMWNALRQDHVVQIKFEYVASRYFVFEIYHAGTLALRHSLSGDEISAADGSIREAIENFNNEIVDALALCGCDVFPQTSGRRPRDSVYKFELAFTRNPCFGENDVEGELVLMTKDMPLNEAADLGIEMTNQSLDLDVSSAKTELEMACFDSFPSNTDVVEFSLQFIDFDEELVDYGHDRI